MKQILSSSDKTEIQTHLKDFVETFASQSKAVARLENVSEAVVIAMLTNKWASISDSMWYNVGNQVGFRKKKDVKMVATLAFQTLITFFTIAKEEGEFFSLVSPGGRGKSVAGDYFEKTNRNNEVFKLNCETYWTKRILLQQMLMQLGKKETSGSLAVMYNTVVRELNRKKQPLLIFDQVGKLPVPVLLFFIAFYNDLGGNCGLVWLSTEDIIKTIDKGLRRNAPGFQELSSRFGTNHIELPNIQPDELVKLCASRGITDREEVATISNAFRGDIRLIDRKYIRAKALQELAKIKKAA